ncbi:MAG: hypothetical protein HYZ65_03375 [Burkholderiales bacterium]|nr:hypothetical protein [Burkholderiales bacterium]
MKADAEFAEQYTQAERIRFAVAGVLAGALIIFCSQTWLFPWFREFVRSAPCRSIAGINGLSVLWYGIFSGLPLFTALLLIATLGWRGRKILRDGQAPPAGEKVLRPTKICRGRQARIIAYLHFAAPLPFFVLALWGAFQAQDMSARMRPEQCSAAPAP